MTTRRRFIGAAAMMAAAIPLLSAPPLAGADEDKIQLMFVQTARDVTADDKKLRLVDVSQQTLYFTDRPVRMAGHFTMSDYMEEWTAAAGPNNFSADPPNASLSVYAPGSNENDVVVVEISNPVIDGDDLVYDYTVIEGEMPKVGGTAALFIDWIGPGGGVGVGFHGVGVGRRGPGVMGW